MATFTSDQMMLWTAFCLSAATSLLLLLRSRRKAATATATSRLPPGPPGWPVVGNILDLGTKPHASLAKFQLKYGPLIWLRLGSVNTLVISSAEAAMEMFKNHDNTFCNRYLNEALKICENYNGTITLGPYGPYWRMLRRICATELFSRKRIMDTAPLRRRCVDKLIKWISDEAKETGNNGVEVARFVFATSFNLIGNLMLSRDLLDPKSTKGNDFFDVTSELVELAARPNIADFFPSLRPFDPQGLKKKMEDKLISVLEIVGSFVKERRCMDEEELRNKDKDFLDVLLEFEGNGKDEPTKISDRNLNIFILELFMGATETTNSTVEWAMTELLSNPTTMKKVREEITEVVGHDRKIEESDIEDLPYLRSVIKETLRLHPPIPLLVPRSVIKDTELMGYVIPKDTQVFVNVWGLGRDPDSWEDPLSFKPERFLNSNVDYRGQNFEFLPFGAGRRICPGLPLGHQMLHLVLGSLLQSFEWSLEDGVTPETLDKGEKMGMSLRKAELLKAVPKAVAM
ncbi:Cytochrome P450 [Macleaya cordata]|uniref:Cytochrome P450 n=1 Tax=Macleaya cordata TaxID=56857 RepID=A0A200RC34_MACCD|nr:Cytochrome P450 [Macleaya cordata]